jgi:hypothetical protein
MQVCKKKFKEVLAEFMEYQDDKYYQDIARRKAYPKEIMWKVLISVHV